MKATFIKPTDHIAPGDLLLIAGNKKLVPAAATVGWLVSDLYKYAGSELRGVLRPSPEESNVN